jgi:hypothetical protein
MTAERTSKGEDDMTTRLGKFESCGDSDLGEVLHGITLDGCCEDCGDAESFGWFAVVDHGGRFFIVSEDSQGFFDYREFGDLNERAKEWDRINTEWEEYSTTVES